MTAGLPALDDRRARQMHRVTRRISLTWECDLRSDNTWHFSLAKDRWTFWVDAPIVIGKDVTPLAGGSSYTVRRCATCPRCFRNTITSGVKQTHRETPCCQPHVLPPRWGPLAARHTVGRWVRSNQQHPPGLRQIGILSESRRRPGFAPLCRTVFILRRVIDSGWARGYPDV